MAITRLSGIDIAMDHPRLTTRRSAFAAAAHIAALGIASRALAEPTPDEEPSSNGRAEPPGFADLIDFIPHDLRSHIANEWAQVDYSPFLKAALASLGTLGGVLRVPGGTFNLAQTIVVPPRVRIIGAGRATSVFKIAHDGDGFRSEASANAFTPVNIGLAHLGLVCKDNRASGGAGFRDRGGTYVDLHDILVSGFRYGCVLDQSEIVSVDLCQFEYSRDTAIWLVNGPDQTPGAQTTFTNRISVSRCQINQADGFGIIDDGGRAHSFRDNNFNGCRLGHLRLAGYGEYVVDGNYFEESAGPPITVSNRTVRGRNVQRPNSVVIIGNLIIAQAGRPSIVFEGATAVAIMGNTFVGKQAPSINGMNTVESLASDGNAVQNDAGLFEGTRAIRHQRSGELAIDRFERLRLATFPSGARRTLRIAMPDARPGDMSLISFEPVLPLRIFMPVAEMGNVAIELENTGSTSVMALDVLVRVKLMKV